MTFWTAFERARTAEGGVVLRIEDLDPLRCRTQFAEAARRDLAWLGIAWEGEVVFQSRRRELYLDAWRRLREGGWIYPCERSRRDVLSAVAAPHDEEPLFPVEWRRDPAEGFRFEQPRGVNWRFRVPDGERVEFFDGRLGRVEKVALRDFGDFVVWNRDDIPAYELAVTVDDAGMTEVVRGEDLLVSTARQLLIHRALGQTPPAWFHCPLVRDKAGRRLAKRTNGLSIAELRAAGHDPSTLLELAASMIR